MASQAKSLDDLNELMRTLTKSALERMLNAEIDHHLKSPRCTFPAAHEVAFAATPTPATTTKEFKANRRNGSF